MQNNHGVGTVDVSGMMGPANSSRLQGHSSSPAGVPFNQQQQQQPHQSSLEARGSRNAVRSSYALSNNNNNNNNSNPPTAMSMPPGFASHSFNAQSPQQQRMMQMQQQMQNQDQQQQQHLQFQQFQQQQQQEQTRRMSVQQQQQLQMLMHNMQQQQQLNKTPATLPPMHQQQQQQQQPGFVGSTLPTFSFVPAPSSIQRGSSSSAQNSSHTTGAHDKNNSNEDTTTAKQPVKSGSGQTAPGFSCTHSTMEEANLLLKQCNRVEKTIYVARQLLGGSAVNGFLRAMSSAQRLKKQRARQIAAHTAKKEDAADLPLLEDDGPVPDVVQKSGDNNLNNSGVGSSGDGEDKHTERETEEELKNETMNPRVAKKILADLTSGIAFCAHMQATIRSILSEPSSSEPNATIPSFHKESPDSSQNIDSAYVKLQQHQQSQSKNTVLSGSSPPILGVNNGIAGEVDSTAKIKKSMLTTTVQQASESLQQSESGGKENLTMQITAGRAPGGEILHPESPSQAKRQSPGRTNPNAETVADGNPKGSTLRKMRKRQIKPGDATEDVVGTHFFDPTGKRKLTKKELAYRAFEMSRFRTLHPGDYVAAKISSHELWILARIVKEWKAVDIPPADMISMSEAKRETFFQEKAIVQDEEEYDPDDLSKSKELSRHLILPLPRTFQEAADWTTRYRKGSRVYAMYPSTTSLYCATVVDNTTYCREDDDIIVVEFDGDEDDITSALPQRHIPARFVTLIPREFPAAQAGFVKKMKKKTVALTGGNSIASKLTPIPNLASSPDCAPAPMEVTPNSAGKLKKTRNVKGQSTKKNESTDDALNDMINEMAYGAEDLGDFDTFDDFDFGDEELAATGSTNLARASKETTGDNTKLFIQKEMAKTVVPTTTAEIASITASKRKGKEQSSPLKKMIMKPPIVSSPAAVAALSHIEKKAKLPLSNNGPPKIRKTKKATMSTSGSKDTLPTALAKKRGMSTIDGMMKLANKKSKN